MSDTIREWKTLKRTSTSYHQRMFFGDVRVERVCTHPVIKAGRTQPQTCEYTGYHKLLDADGHWTGLLKVVKGASVDDVLDVTRSTETTRS